MFNIIHNQSIFKIDFIIRKNTSSYRNTEFQRRRRLELDDTQIWIVSLEDLIISKLFWAKESFLEMQIRDINNLLISITKFRYPVYPKLGEYIRTQHHLREGEAWMIPLRKLQKKSCEMFQMRSPIERLKMGCSMYDTSSTYLVTRAILKENPHISQIDLRKELFLKFYRNDFNPIEQQKILNHFDQITS